MIFGTSELDIAQNNTTTDFTIASDIRQAIRAANSGLPLAVVKSGQGTLVLSGNNTYAGGTDINEGTIKLGSDTAIGNFNAGNNLVSSPVVLGNKAGTLLDLNGHNATIGNLTGGGLDGGTVAIGANTLTINLTAASTYSGALTGSGNLVINSSAPTLIFTLGTTANSGFTGTVTVNNGILSLTNGTVLSGQTTANLANATGFTIANGGGLLIDNSSSLQVDRISSTAPITLMNTAPNTASVNVGLNTQTDSALGQFPLVPRTTTTGPVTLEYGVNTLRSVTANANVNPILNVASLTRANNSTMVVLGTNLDTPWATQRGDITAANAASIVADLVGGGSTVNGSPNISILPWAIGQSVVNAGTGLGNTFVTYSTVGGFGNGFRALTTSEYEQWTASGTGFTMNNNVRFSSNGVDLPLSGGAYNMNALLVENTSTTTGQNIAATGFDSLNVQSGAFLFLGSATPQATTVSGFGSGITIGTNEYIFHVLNTSAAGGHDHGRPDHQRRLAHERRRGHSRAGRGELRAVGLDFPQPGIDPDKFDGQHRRRRIQRSDRLPRRWFATHCWRFLGFVEPHDHPQSRGGPLLWPVPITLLRRCRATPSIPTVG
ncbi:MAG: autotransporter-associated beta strand repeat-containing protein [Chthoniobacter sp.]